MKYNYCMMLRYDEIAVLDTRIVFSYTPFFITMKLVLIIHPVLTTMIQTARTSMRDAEIIVRCEYLIYVGFLTVLSV